MSKGFTIKCNKCGKETVYTKCAEGTEWPWSDISNNDNIAIDTADEEPVCIECKCGNILDRI